MFGVKDTDDNVSGRKGQNPHVANPRLAKPVPVFLEISLPLSMAFTWEICVNIKWDLPINHVIPAV